MLAKKSPHPSLRGAKLHPRKLAVAATESSPPGWAWHRRTLLRLRQQLVAACASLLQAGTAPAETGGMDRADSANDRESRAGLLAKLNAAEDQLGEVDAALQRLIDGNYGRCAETGRPIAAARLRALPWTRFSRAAAGRHERKGVKPGETTP